MVVLELANPKRKLIQNKKEYVDWVKKNNGIMNLYQTVYKFKYARNQYQAEYDTAIIDKMFFDMDSKNAIKICCKFHEYLVKHNIKHYMLQSSYLKFHIYVMCKVQELDNKKAALKNGMVGLANQIGLTFGREKSYDLDVATFGDISRICPIPNTYKPKRKGYCTYITENDLKSLDRLKQKTIIGKSRITYYGETLFDLKPFDIEPSYKELSKKVIDPIKLEVGEGIINLFPPFIKKVLLNYETYAAWDNRWKFCILCRDMGISRETTDEIAQQYFSQQNRTDYLGNNYNHFKKTNVINLVFNSNRYKFPSADNIIDKGYELEQEDIEFINNLYF